MILGSFSFSNKPGRSDLVRSIIRWNTIDDVSFHSVLYERFEGGYFLNAKLPYRPEDMFYLNKEKGILILFSGNIYNFTDLIPRDEDTRSMTQTELVASQFTEKGTDFVKKLNGDFTLFILQWSKKQAWLFRDHLGVRPMAFIRGSESLTFCSDITTLCRAVSDGKSVCPDFLLTYFKYIDRKRTPDKSVEKLLPGHYLHWSEKGVRIIKYWDPGKIRTQHKLDYNAMLADLKNIVIDAVRIRCDSRFNAGAHVTGGLDSGIVSVIAREEYAQQKEFYGFSWSPASYTPENMKYDERSIILSSCGSTNISPVFSDMNVDNFKKSVSDYYFNNGYFSEDKTTDQVARMNVNLVFSGWGGDEFISTGDRGIETDLLRGLRFKIFFRRNPVIPIRKFARYLFQYVIFPALGMLDKATAASFREEARYIKKPYKKSDKKAIRNFYSHTSRRQLHLRLLKFYHLQERCESWAVNGFRKGIEYRYPLLDKRIVEYMLKVPSELLCRTDYFRPLLRIIGKGIIPEEVRLQNDKSDPVCWKYVDELSREASILWMDEVEIWKRNRDLHFIDFTLLSRDIQSYREGSAGTEPHGLFRALVYIKAIHEFTRKYHENS